MLEKNYDEINNNILKEYKDFMNVNEIKKEYEEETSQDIFIKSFLKNK